MSAGPQPATQESIYPDPLAAKEAGLVKDRRLALNLGDTAPQVGVALSGGGIRSATFSLGLFQALARHDRLKEIDYLSTVSGGGYFGGFFGKLFQPAPEGAGKPIDSANRARTTLADSQSAPLTWLRENGRYIAPTGSGDFFFAAAIYLRNWVAVQYVVGITLLTVFLLANTLRGWAWDTAMGCAMEDAIGGAMMPVLWASPWLILPGALAAIALVPLGVAYWLTQKYQESRLTGLRRAVAHWNYPLTALVLLIGLAIGTLFLLQRGSAPAWVPDGGAAPWCYAYVIFAGLMSIAVYALSGWQAPQGTEISLARNRLSRWLGQVLLGFVMLAAFAIVDSLGQTAYAVWSTNRGSIVAVGLASGAAVFIARQFAGYLTSDQSHSRKLMHIPTQVIGLIVGVLLALIVATFWAAVAHAILWQGQTPSGDPGQQLIEHYAPAKPVLSLSVDSRIIVSPPEVRPAAAGPTSPEVALAGSAFIVALVIGLLTGKTMSFLNLSTIQPFYAARLTRAYLGACNPHRTGYGADTKSGGTRNPNALNVTEVIAGDDVRLENYRPDANGGPLHLINVTINETVAGTSQLEQRDRKGLGMAIGPCGISVARIHHAMWSGKEQDKQRELTPIASSGGEFAVFERLPTHVDSLTLGQWVGVSGAAFTTGLGARTNLGLSLLLGFSNVRLGYWWDSGIAPRSRKENQQRLLHVAKPTDWLEPLFSAQVYLADEFLARFHGPHRQRWYLSDGGHYENTALYELIRRRLPLMITSDNGCDGKYLFDDVANLVRKARIDFNAEVRFLDHDELDALLDPAVRKAFGTPAELRPASADEPGGDVTTPARSRCHALLARIYYDGNSAPGSLLVVVKPSLMGDEPLDVLQYHDRHPTFPQETTMDQFFDEAQWESYRKLGSHIGDLLFGPTSAAGKWAPGLMRRHAA